MLVKVAMPNNFQLRVIPTFKSWFLEKQGDIHYIGGAEVLPPPLEPPPRLPPPPPPPPEELFLGLGQKMNSRQGRFLLSII